MSQLTYFLNNEDELIKMKEKTTKVKIIALNKLGKSPLMNPKYLKNKERTKLIYDIKYYLDSKTDVEIDLEFNEICIDEIFDNKCDINSYPIYDLTNNTFEKNTFEKNTFEKVL